MSQGRPRVSVIVPLFNMGRHVRQALESVIAQTFDSWDAWVVDDGSSDEGPAVVRHLAEQFPDRIHYLEHEGHQNRGVSASRNLAIERSHGEFVAFLDADDVWLPDKLKRQTTVFDTHPDVGIVYSTGVPINADGTLWSPVPGVDPPVKITLDAEGRPRVGYGTANKPVDLFRELIEHCCLVNSATVLRRSVLDKAGRFDESIRYPIQCEDWLLYTCAAYHCLSYFIDEPLIQYRIHSQHFSASLIGNDIARFRQVAVFLEKLPQHLHTTNTELAVLLSEARRRVYGRVLSRSEEAWEAGQGKQAWALVKFAWSTFPSLVLSRRTARYGWRILRGNGESQRQLVHVDRAGHTGNSK